MKALRLITLLIFSAHAIASGPLPALKINPERITVSGISSGAQMAHQLHIAYPEVFSGAGIIAGGPFGCAEGSLAVAMTRCMGRVNGELPLGQFIKEIKLAAGDGKLGETAALADDPVWIFHGSLDKTVAAELSVATVALYAEFMPAENIRYIKAVGAAHNFPTRDHGDVCTASKPPFIGACDFDAAGQLLQHLYADLETPPVRPGTEAELIETRLPGAVAAGLSERAYLYIPPLCRTGGQACKAHLVLHGCGQSSVQIGSEFIEHSGYLPWAAANDIVLAFPQVSPATSNPYACWDWWGYTGSSYRWRDGVQVKLLAEWIQELAIP